MIFDEILKICFNFLEFLLNKKLNFENLTKEDYKKLISDIKKENFNTVFLSKRIYKSFKNTELICNALIKKYAKEQKHAKKLASLLYEGYNFKEDILKIKKDLPKYLLKECEKLAIKQAKRLKTPALKAAYLEALNSKTKQNFEKNLKIATFEKGRYYAKRIVDTELDIDWHKQKAKEILEDKDVECVKFMMTKTHPRCDICDYFAKADFYGLGAGVYPKQKAPTLPLHPFCKCVLMPLLSVSAKGAKFDKMADLRFIKGLSNRKQIEILGSKNRLERFLNEENFLKMYNAKKPKRYKIKRISDNFKNL